MNSTRITRMDMKAAGDVKFATANSRIESRETHARRENEESAEWPFGPWPGQGSPTLGANRATPKKKRPAFAGRRSGDAIPGGVR